MTVREYYTKRLKSLPKKNQYHFATSLKNWLKTDEFDDLLIDLETPSLPSSFQKDLDLKKPKADFYARSDAFLASSFPLTALTSEDIDYIAETELRFPRKKNVFALLSQKCLHFSGDPAQLVHVATYTIIRDSNFYTRDLTESSLPLYRPLLVKCAKLINQNLTPIPLESKLSFLVATKLVNATKTPSANISISPSSPAPKKSPAFWPKSPTGFLPLVQKIKTECDTSLQKSPFLLDPRKPDEVSLAAAEPLNTFYILSGLDDKV